MATCLFLLIVPHTRGSINLKLKNVCGSDKTTKDIYAWNVQHILQYMSSNTTKQSQQLSVDQMYMHQKKIRCQVISQDRQTSVFSCVTKLGALIYVAVWPEEKNKFRLNCVKECQYSVLLTVITVGNRHFVCTFLRISKDSL